MKTFLSFCAISLCMLSCQNANRSTESDPKDSTTVKSTSDLPFTASYTAGWSSDVSDEDQKIVLNSYKYWADGNMSELAKLMADTVNVILASGVHMKQSNAGLLKMWTASRDSMSSVKIDMESWHKMYAKDKKEGFIVTWYGETDTYKTGKTDSASYHDINQVKNGKIVAFEQYKRPKK